MKRGAGHLGRPGSRVTKSYCYLCRVTHPGQCPLTPEERRTLIQKRQGKERK